MATCRLSTLLRARGTFPGLPRLSSLQIRSQIRSVSLNDASGIYATRLSRPTQKYFGKSISQDSATLHRRFASTSSSNDEPKGGSNERVPNLSPFVTGLLLLGGVAVIYGIYELYFTLTMWPPEVRGDLRKGLSAKAKGNMEEAIAYLKRAWETAKQMPIEAFKSQPYLKTSGIAICLAEALEQDHKDEGAYQIYADALNQFVRYDAEANARGAASKQDTSAAAATGRNDPVSGHEKLRAIAIAYKLGEEAGRLHKPKEVQEQWLTWAVEEILRSIPMKKVSSAAEFKFDDVDSGVKSQAEHRQHNDDESRGTIIELGLPVWARALDIAAPLEALGTYYARLGNLEFAMPLYLNAISVLIPPPPKESSADDRCRGAQLMNGLAELIMQIDNNPQVRHQAEQWVGKAIDIVSSTKNRKGAQDDLCELTLAASLFNAGILRELAGDEVGARKLYESSLNEFKTIRRDDGIAQNQRALRRLAGHDAKALSANAGITEHTEHNPDVDDRRGDVKMDSEVDAGASADANGGVGLKHGAGASPKRRQEGDAAGVTFSATPVKLPLDRDEGKAKGGERQEEPREIEVVVHEEK